MGVSLHELAQLVGGTVSGDAAVCVHGAATIRDAQHGEITLAEGTRFLDSLRQSRASAVVLPHGISADLPAIHVDHVPTAFARIVRHFRPQRSHALVGISPAAVVHPSAQVAADAVIHPQCYIGEDCVIGPRCVLHPGVKLLAGCRLGADVTIFPNVVLYEETAIGNRVIIHAGAVLGAYGFGYQTVGGRHQLSAQLGYVEIADDVEIGAAATIDRGTYGPTRIGVGTKIDNQVMIGHNCHIGRHNLLCSQVGIAGSCTTGDYVVMGGQVGVKDHIQIGDRARLAAQSGIMRDVEADAGLFGTPAKADRLQMHIIATLDRLPDMRRQLRELEHQVSELRQTRNHFPRADAA